MFFYVVFLYLLNIVAYNKCSKLERFQRFFMNLYNCHGRRAFAYKPELARQKCFAQCEKKRLMAYLNARRRSVDATIMHTPPRTSNFQTFAKCLRAGRGKNAAKQSYTRLVKRAVSEGADITTTACWELFCIFIILI